ncbi:GTPase HflX [Candidatus Gracilibacteria bacterium]|nr:MAG: GTPase HflX [Candidatus Gracilibacteria bacterium]
MSRKKSERELQQIQQNLEYQTGELKVFLADVVSVDISKNENLEDRMIELENLVNTYGGIVILEHIQKKAHPDYDTYIGGGKLDEIISEMQLKGANLLIIGNILKPSQIYKINEKLRKIGAKAWDRIDLILKIFEKNAKSREAKLQIELAAISHMGPRIYDMGMELGKQGGKGKGETNTEIMKRHLQRRKIAIKDELEHYIKVRAEHRKNRVRKGLNTVGVVGYTNAGKSTLTNSLTKKGVLAEDKLFATLGTSVGKMWVEATEKNNFRGREYLINDTIGFIRDLPPELIDAFTSTLEDSIEADLLLHVIDAGDPKIEEKIKVVDDILKNIGATGEKIYVFNKIDGIEGKIYEKTLENGEVENISYLEYLKEKFAEYNPIFVSAFKKINLEELKDKIVEILN